MDTVHGFRYFHAIKFPLFNALGQVETVGGISIDITQRKQAEAELRRSEERWQLAIQGSHDGIWDVNIQTHENFSSVRCATMLGYEAQELGNSYPDWVRYIHPDDVKQVLAATQAHLDQKTPFYFAEYRVRCKDGSYKWILNRGQAIWDQQGKPIRMVGSQTDISDRKQAEEIAKLAFVKSLPMRLSAWQFSP
jgi:PAS domain S-box-containing protein